VEAETFPEQFKQLEHKIEALVRTCRELKQTRSELEARINELEDALNGKQSAEQRHLEEKSLVHDKIGELLGRLDQVLQSE
jgi:cell division protein FtsB